MEKQEIEAKREELSQKMYQAPYHSVSEWGKIQIDARIIVSNARLSEEQQQQRVDYLNSLPPDEVSLKFKIGQLEGQLEQAKLENLDLWEENQELKMEIEDKREVEEKRELRKKRE